MKALAACLVSTLFFAFAGCASSDAGTASGDETGGSDSSTDAGSDSDLSDAKNDADARFDARAKDGPDASDAADASRDGLPCDAAVDRETATCSCPTGLVDCDGVCVDTKWDDDHCGGCATTCAAPAVCSIGTCSASCALPRKACGAKCVDTASDPANCGDCGIACSGAAAYCRDGTCQTPLNVLFFAPDGDSETTEKAYLPSGSIVTAANETTWRAMTTAQFKKFTAVIVGDHTTSSWTSDQLQALYDTRDTWGAAIDGRILVQTLDPGFHALSGRLGSVTYLKASMQWIVGGKGTALYVSGDYDRRGLDFLSPFGTFTENATFGDRVHIVDATSPVMHGTNDADLSYWSNTFHSIITTWPTTFHLVADLGVADAGGGPSGDPTQALVLTRDATTP